MPSSKKGKNAKDGGVLAAVKKQNGSQSKSPPSSTSSPQVQSPEIRPVVPSPVLDALSSTSVSASTIASNTQDWTRGALVGSPGNLISLSGESPPTQPSSYEDSSRLHHAWTPQRTYMSPQPSSPSPPTAMRRPLSFQMEGHVSANAPDPRAQPSASSHRRSSISSQFSHARVGSNPPPPHHPQPHFYGAPELDFDTGPQLGGLKAGERGYHFSFDIYPRPSTEPGPGSDAVVVAGYEGGLKVYSVTKRGLEPVAHLKGLRGGVYNAKILPWTSQSDTSEADSLVAVVVHGPVLPSGDVDAELPSGGRSPTELVGSPRPDVAYRDIRQSRPSEIRFYQTSVEVYSLKTSALVAVLLQAPAVTVNSPVPITSSLFKPPPPTGSFNIRADAGSILVSSGVTGECWIYRQVVPEQGHPTQFGCVAKLWTSIQQGPRADVSEEADLSRGPLPPSRMIQPTPVLAFNGRWIAYCPPAPSSQISLRAHVAVPTLGKAPGVSTVTAPQLPAVSSGVDLPSAGGLMNKLMRETTQELLQGARWVSQQGVQAWNSYWNKGQNQPPTQQVQARSPPLQPQQWGASYPPRQDNPQFPPTHGTPGQPVTKEPGIVSIVDLETFTHSTSLHALTTFTVPLGCSFLSFSPSGLSLFTASSKGDVQTVWDLMRIQCTKSSPLQVSSSGSGGPHVRQIAQFSRMTVAKIVDVAWAKPNGERIAMVTERGTTHLLDIPSSAFTWPPPRRRRDAPDGGGTSSEPSSSAVSIASNAIGAAIGAARPLVSRPRRSSANSAGLTGTNIVDSASQGGRAIAASISNSLGRTGNAIHQLRLTADNRVSLPSGSTAPTPGCVVWIASRRYHSLFVAAGGLVRTFPSKARKSSSRQGPLSRLPRGNAYKDFKIPALPDDTIAASVRHFINHDEELYLSDREIDGGDTITLDTRLRTLQSEMSAEAAIPQAEIESSAPYQPFHTDRRVALYEYTTSTTVPQLPPVSVFLADASLDNKGSSKKKKRQSVEQTGSRPWAFGQMISAIKLDLGNPPLLEEGNQPDDHRALPASAMERVLHMGENAEQIVVTTRRRRGARHVDHDDDGFFEDDCEVLDFADQRV